MQINNIGYHHFHDADFKIERPNGSGDYLLLLLDCLSYIVGKCLDSCDCDHRI